MISGEPPGIRAVASGRLRCRPLASTARLDDPALTVRGPFARALPPGAWSSKGGDWPPSHLVRTPARPDVVVVSPESDRQGRALGSHGGRGARAGLPERLLLREQGRPLCGRSRAVAGRLAAGLVDRYYWIQAPFWLGEGGVPAPAGLPARGLDQADRWRVVERRSLGEDTLLVLDRS